MSLPFHDLHHAPQPLLLPNAWDHASAAASAGAGFAAVGTTSLGVAASAGLVDGTGATREQTVALAIGLCGQGWMVSADLENGYSEDPAEVADLCAELWDAGVAGVNLEDGRADGSLRSAGHHADILRAVASAVPELLVNGRTDTTWLRAGSLDEAIRRVAAYADAGADCVFVPGLADPRDLERLVAATPVPVNALLTPGGPGVVELAEAGVARVSFGSLLYRIALGAAVGALEQAAHGRSVEAGPAMTYEQVQALAP